MANKKVKIYQVYFQDNSDKKVNYDVSEFFRELRDRFINDKLHLPQLYNGKKLYLFDYTPYEPNDYSEFVIPFGKLKTNVPYKIDEQNIKAIVQEREKLFDVNLLYYSKYYDAAIITTDKEGPNNKAIEAFLNCFIPGKYSIRIKPILHSKGLETIAESRKVRSISISINLDPSIERFYNQHINSDSNLLKGILNIMSISRNDVKSKTFKLELGMGHYKEYIDYEYAISLLNELEIADSDIFKEIKINYYDGHSEKIETVKLKNSDIELSDKIYYEQSDSIMMSELMEKGRILLENHLEKIRLVNREIDENAVDINGDIEISRGECHAETQAVTI